MTKAICTLTLAALAAAGCPAKDEPKREDYENRNVVQLGTSLYQAEYGGAERQLQVFRGVDGVRLCLYTEGNKSKCNSRAVPIDAETAAKLETGMSGHRDMLHIVDKAKHAYFNRGNR